MTHKKNAEEIQRFFSVYIGLGNHYLVAVLHLSPQPKALSIS